jgi:hypothetical protein
MLLRYKDVSGLTIFHRHAHLDEPSGKRPLFCQIEEALGTEREDISNDRLSVCVNAVHPPGVALDANSSDRHVCWEFGDVLPLSLRLAARVVRHKLVAATLAPEEIIKALG